MAYLHTSIVASTCPNGTVRKHHSSRPFPGRRDRVTTSQVIPSDLERMQVADLHTDDLAARLVMVLARADIPRPSPPLGSATKPACRMRSLFRQKSPPPGSPKGGHTVSTRSPCR